MGVGGEWQGKVCGLKIKPLLKNKKPTYLCAPYEFLKNIYLYNLDQNVSTE